jgi:hypothetical protein
MLEDVNFILISGRDLVFVNIPVMGSTEPPIQVVPGVLSLRVKDPG